MPDAIAICVRTEGNSDWVVSYAYGPAIRCKEEPWVWDELKRRVTEEVAEYGSSGQFPEALVPAVVEAAYDVLGVFPNRISLHLSPYTVDMELIVPTPQAPVEVPDDEPYRCPECATIVEPPSCGEPPCCRDIARNKSWCPRCQQFKEMPGQWVQTPLEAKRDG